MKTALGNLDNSQENLLLIILIKHEMKDDIVRAYCAFFPWNYTDKGHFQMKLLKENVCILI